MDAYCRASGDVPATFSATLVRRELDRLQQSGELQLESALAEAEAVNELLKNFIIALVEGTTEFDLDAIAEVAEVVEVEKVQLEALYKKDPRKKAKSA
ncbi:MAG: hypothetical protein AAF063_09255 [Cyanobacteria bacterium J06643_5]